MVLVLRYPNGRRKWYHPALAQFTWCWVLVEWKQRIISGPVCVVVSTCWLVPILRVRVINCFRFCQQWETDKILRPQNTQKKLKTKKDKCSSEVTHPCKCHSFFLPTVGHSYNSQLLHNCSRWHHCNKWWSHSLLCLCCHPLTHLVVLKKDEWMRHCIVVLCFQ